MEDIKIGEYVRTNYGRIGRIIEITNDYIFTDKDTNCIAFKNCNHFFKDTFDKVVKKHSFNIIDLIEAGDYVNGKEVIMDLKKSKEWYKSKDDFITCKDYTFEEKEIKGVVTKQQFKEMEYRVDE